MFVWQTYIWDSESMVCFRKSKSILNIPIPPYRSPPPSFPQPLEPARLCSSTRATANATYILSLYYPTSSGDSSFLGPPSFVVPHFRSTALPSLQLSLTQAPFSPFASSTLRRSSTTMTLRRSFLDYDFASVNLFLQTPRTLLLPMSRNSPSN